MRYFFDDRIDIDDKFNFRSLYIFNPLKFLETFERREKVERNKRKVLQHFEILPKKLKINKTVPFTCSILRVFSSNSKQAWNFSRVKKERRKCEKGSWKDLT